MIAKRLIISALVQGVFFRANSQQTAQELGLVGWIKNTDNDKVEAVIQGEVTKIEEFINWCQYKAPGKVRKIKEKQISIDKGFESFEILY